MLPGLFVKRWLFISLVGILLVVLGLAITARLTPVFFIVKFINAAIDTLANAIPRYVSGPLALLIGIFLLAWGQRRVLSSITRVLMPDGDEELVDVLITHHKLNKGPRLLTVGGGTGLSTLLRGLKKYSANITAVVTVADDGGSSGRLRREHGVLPPGDIRNCLAALSDEEKLMTELFQYRFEVGEGLSGHSFGNLFLTAMSDITGDLDKAIAASSKVLAVRGRVLPATLDNVMLWAEMEDGRRIEGESNIPEAGGTIVKVGCVPENPIALPQVIADIQKADFIIIGPGSLYTSIIPNLLVPGILEAIANRRAPCVYVCNIMAQPGETDGYTVSDHVRAIDRVAQTRLFDVVLAQKNPPSAKAIEKYAASGSNFIEVDREELGALGCPLVLANIMKENRDGTVKHDSDKLAGVLMRWYNRQ
ncbi:Uncharacterized protein family UPF0052 [Thalassoporum mexicanum PCC 7367]|nr:Uncharacterized protein family UPF0052 [Pseudanabaena sp. PCC 7367]